MVSPDFMEKVRAEADRRFPPAPDGHGGERWEQEAFIAGAVWAVKYVGNP